MYSCTVRGYGVATYVAAEATPLLPMSVSLGLTEPGVSCARIVNMATVAPCARKDPHPG